MRIILIFTASLSLLASSTTYATKYDMSPHPSILLRTTPGIIVQSATTKVTHYDLNGKELHTYELTDRIRILEISCDEKYVLIAGSSGHIRVFLTNANTCVCDINVKLENHEYLSDASFSPDGSCFVTSLNHSVSAFQTQGGKLIHHMAHDTCFSACISDDCESVIVVQGGNNQYISKLNLKTQTSQSLSLLGAWPIRITSDGNYALLRNCNSGSNERLRVVDFQKGEWHSDLGDFSLIERIRPLKGGECVIWAKTKSPNASSWTDQDDVGAIFESSEVTLNEKYRQKRDGLHSAMDFDPIRNIGVTTEFNLMTHVMDLKTGKSILEINNSANYDAVMTSTFTRGSARSFESWWWIASTVVVLSALAVWWRRRKRRIRESTNTTTYIS